MANRNRREQKQKCQTRRYIWIRIRTHTHTKFVQWSSKRKIIGPHKKSYISIINMSVWCLYVVVVAAVAAAFLSFIRSLRVLFFCTGFFRAASIQAKQIATYQHVNVEHRQQLVLLFVHKFHSFESSLTMLPWSLCVPLSLFFSNCNREIYNVRRFYSALNCLVVKVNAKTYPKLIIYVWNDDDDNGGSSGHSCQARTAYEHTKIQNEPNTTRK